MLLFRYDLFLLVFSRAGTHFLQGASIGGIIWPITVNQLGERISFANGTRVTAAITGLLLLISNFITKTQPRSKTKSDQATKPAFRVIFQDSAYFISIAGAFLISLGLFFPCTFLSSITTYLCLTQVQTFTSSFMPSTRESVRTWHSTQ